MSPREAMVFRERIVRQLRRAGVDGKLRESVMLGMVRMYRRAQRRKRSAR